MDQLRAAVLRDLEWLLNAVAIDSVVDLDGRPAVARSVLNYGMPNMTGVTGANANQIAKRIRQALIDFEPRLDKETVRVTYAADADRPGSGMSFRIEAELWAYPVPIPLLLRTDFDLDGTHVQVQEAEDKSGEG